MEMARPSWAFLSLLAIHAGHPLDLSRLDPEASLEAMVVSFHGGEVPLRHQRSRPSHQTD